jgi:hypothetical protein
MHLPIIIVNVIILIILFIYMWNIHAYMRQMKNTLKAIHRIIWDEVTEKEKLMNEKNGFANK